MLISGLLNESLIDITHLEVIKNDRLIQIQPFSGVSKLDTKTNVTTIIEVPLPVYTFDLTQGPFTLSGNNSSDPGMEFHYVYNTEMPRKLRGTIFRNTQTWTDVYFDTVRYLTLKEVIEFIDPSTSYRQMFNIKIQYDYNTFVHRICLTLPTP